MADVNWIRTIPSDGSLTGVGARDIRQQKKAIADWLGESFQFPDSTNPLKPGGSHPLLGTQSASSFSLVGGGSEHTYKGFFASDTSRFMVYWQGRKGPPSPGGRTRTMYMGGPNYVETSSDVGVAVALRVSGWTLLTIPDVRNRWVPFGNAIFDATPTVLVTSSNSDYIPVVDAVFDDGFSLNMQPLSGSGSNVTIRWTASGTSSGVL
jgi:hypothetical protein